MKGKHYSCRAIEKGRQAVVEDRTTFSGLGRRLERDFNISPSFSTGYRWFHEAADQIDLSRDYEPWAVDGFSGYLAVDELYDGFCVLVATDPVNDKTISVQLCKSATDKKLRRFLTHVKGLGIFPKVIITDGSTLYNRIPQQVWPEIRHQLCIFHLARLVTQQVLKDVGTVSRYLKQTEEPKEFGHKILEEPLFICDAAGKPYRIPAGGNGKFNSKPDLTNPCIHGRDLCFI